MPLDSRHSHAKLLPMVHEQKLQVEDEDSRQAFSTLSSSLLGGAVSTMQTMECPRGLQSNDLDRTEVLK